MIWEWQSAAARPDRSGGDLLQLCSGYESGHSVSRRRLPACLTDGRRLGLVVGGSLSAAGRSFVAGRLWTL
jgi:hypothetical protein